jgi:transcriptional regulator with XRE-family HTH domain
MLEEILAQLNLDDREWLIVVRRTGRGKRETLEQVGKALGVTRERIRQIEKVARRRIAEGSEKLGWLADLLERKHEDLGPPFGENLSDQARLRRLEVVLRRDGIDSSTIGRSRLITVFRMVFPKYATRWPALTYWCCAFAEPVLAYGPVAQALKDHREARRQWSYSELLFRVLEQEGAPMHWLDALEAAERLGRRRTIYPSPFFNTLGHKKLIFVRVGPGTYGLRKWGMQERPTNVDMVATFLAEKGRPAALGDLAHRFVATGVIKANSLQMMLDMNPRFYRSIEGAFGLRIWLPPRHRQTLRSPQWQVESADSFGRVARATSRGYDVETICARDIAKD